MVDVGHALNPIVVTGAQGYLGDAVCRALNRHGLQYAGLAHRPAGKLVACDMTDEASVRAHIAPHSHVIHCAAIVPSTAEGYADENAAAESLAMIDALLCTRPQHIVFPSSMTVYAPDAQMPVDESDVTSNAIGYAAGKIRAERKLLSSGISTSVLRLPGLFGPPRRDGLLYNAAIAFAAGKRPSLPADPPLWAALHVDDAASYCVSLIQAPGLSSRILNVGYPGKFSISRAMQDLAALFARPAPDMKEGPCFAMRLDRLQAVQGLVASTWNQRLGELADWATETAAPC
ncbi:MAG: nucleoside-diphosphate-sugar epimerase [Hyphomicrobiaceae bacterium]|jgi:nucleoside-diphosphate-sugar epimerase